MSVTNKWSDIITFHSLDLLHDRASLSSTWCRGTSACSLQCSIRQDSLWDHNSQPLITACQTWSRNAYYYEQETNLDDKHINKGKSSNSESIWSTRLNLSKVNFMHKNAPRNETGGTQQTTVWHVTVLRIRNACRSQQSMNRLNDKIKKVHRKRCELCQHLPLTLTNR